MVLEYVEYAEMGGTLPRPAFFMYERKAEYLIRAQAAGQTGRRLDALAEIPQAVKDCVFDLVDVLSGNGADGRQVSSESQTQGGVSESYSYVTKTDAEVAARCEALIADYFYGGGIGGLLYRGAGTCG